MWDVSNPAFWAVIAVITPLLIVLLFIGAKFLWGLWPFAFSLGLSGYSVYRLGIDWFWLVAAGIAFGIVLTWLWQRTVIFLKFDRRLEKVMMISD